MGLIGLTKTEKKRDIISFAAHDLKIREPVKGLISREVLDYIDKHNCSMSRLKVIKKLRNDVPLSKHEEKIFREMQSEEKEADALRMFDRLKKHIGKRVRCTVWNNGVEATVVGVLQSVSYFSHVELDVESDYISIPFIDVKEVISVILLYETGEVLYLNPSVEHESLKNEDAVDEAKRKMFGDVIIDKQRDRRIKAKFEKAVQEANLEVKDLKYTLMKEGLALVKPETAEEWLQFVDNNTNDRDSVIVVETIISMMKKLDVGISFEDAKQQTYYDELFSESIDGAITKALFYFSKQGDEYKKYWNKQYGIKDLEKYTESFEVLALKKK